jgi:hypothetical protein
MNPLSAIILAAGRSRRMGRFKPLLPLGDTTVVERVVGLYAAAGIEDICVVSGYNGEALHAAAGGPCPCAVSPTGSGLPACTPPSWPECGPYRMRVALFSSTRWISRWCARPPLPRWSWRAHDAPWKPSAIPASMDVGAIRCWCPPPWNRHCGSGRAMGACRPFGRAGKDRCGRCPWRTKRSLWTWTPKRITNPWHAGRQRRTCRRPKRAGCS